MCINQKAMSTPPGFKTFLVDRKQHAKELVAEEDRERVRDSQSHPPALLRESKVQDTYSYGKVIQWPYKAGFGWGAPAGESQVQDTSSYRKVIQRPYKAGFGWGAPASSYYGDRQIGFRD